ncbi:MAG: hypothetical protein WA783_00115 [Phormidesmis sp.]
MVTSQKDQIQSLIADIEQVLSKEKPRTPWIKASETESQRQALVRAQAYLMSLQQSFEAPGGWGPVDPTTGQFAAAQPSEVASMSATSISATSMSATNMTGVGSDAASESDTSAQAVMQALLTEMKFLKSSALQPLRLEIDSLQEDRDQLVQEVKGLSDQRSQALEELNQARLERAQLENLPLEGQLEGQLRGQLAEPQDSERTDSDHADIDEAQLNQFLQVLMTRLQESLSTQVTQTLDQLESEHSQAMAKLTAATEIEILELKPTGQIEEIRQIQSRSDQLLANIDSTLQGMFETLQTNIDSYQISLNEGIENMHSLGRQGEVIVRSLVDHLTQQLGQTIPPEPAFYPARSTPFVDEGEFVDEGDSNTDTVSSLNEILPASSDFTSQGWRSASTIDDLELELETTSTAAEPPNADLPSTNPSAIPLAVENPSDLEPLGTEPLGTEPSLAETLSVTETLSIDDMSEVGASLSEQSSVAPSSDDEPDDGEPEPQVANYTTKDFIREDGTIDLDLLKLDIDRTEDDSTLTRDDLMIDAAVADAQVAATEADLEIESQVKPTADAAFLADLTFDDLVVDSGIVDSEIDSEISVPDFLSDPEASTDNAAENSLLTSQSSTLPELGLEEILPDLGSEGSDADATRGATDKTAEDETAKNETAEDEAISDATVFEEETAERPESAVMPDLPDSANDEIDLRSESDVDDVLSDDLMAALADDSKTAEQVAMETSDADLDAMNSDLEEVVVFEPDSAAIAPPPQTDSFLESAAIPDLPDDEETDNEPINKTEDEIDNETSDDETQIDETQIDETQIDELTFSQVEPSAGAIADLAADEIQGDPWAAVETVTPSAPSASDRELFAQEVPSAQELNQEPLDQEPPEQSSLEQDPLDQEPLEQEILDQETLDQETLDQGTLDQGTLDPSPRDRLPIPELPNFDSGDLENGSGFSGVAAAGMARGAAGAAAIAPNNSTTTQPPAQPPEEDDGDDDPTNGEPAEWFLGIDLGATGISAVLINQLGEQVYPLCWNVAGDSETNRFRFPAVVQVDLDALGEPQLGTVGPLALQQSPSLLRNLKLMVKTGIPNSQSNEPQMQWADHTALPLTALQAALVEMVATLHSDHMSCRAVGIKNAALRRALADLRGVIVGYPTNWPDTYSFNIREALLSAEIVSSPDQIFFVEEVIAALLSALPAPTAASDVPENQQPGLYNCNWSGGTVVISAGAILTETAVVELPADLDQLSYQDFSTRGYNYAGDGIDQDIICQLLHLALPTTPAATDKAPNRTGSEGDAGGTSRWEALGLSEIALPQPGEADRVTRHRLRQRLNDSPLGREAILAAREIKLALQEEEEVEVELGDRTWVITRKELEAKVFIPYIQRINRQVNALLGKKNLATQAVQQVVCTGGSASLGTIARWLRQKFPNATIIQDTYTGEYSNSCSRIAYGLANLCHYQRVLDANRHQYNDYFLLLELLRILPEQPLPAGGILHLLEQRGIDTQACQAHVLALIEGHLPPGLVPTAGDRPLISAQSSEIATYKALSELPLFRKQGGQIYIADPQQGERLRSHLETLLATKAQSLSEPMTTAHLTSSSTALGQSTLA